MKLKNLYLVLLALFFWQQLEAQENFYETTAIREIRIRFPYHDWRYKLDSVFQNEGDEGRLTCSVTIDGTSYENAGIRYKGYSSYNSNAIKNPFNIDLDYKIVNQNHQGYTKLKLSNVIHDPSFLREVLAYEIARKYMPAPQANYANVFVNDTFIGLYTNVEAIDKRFVKKHFGSDNHAFFKGEPDPLIYPFGENSNLAYSHGEDSSSYYAYYKAESDYGWRQLLSLIQKLDVGVDQVQEVLNIDQALWMMAFNEVIVNLDSYMGYSQNYYLYEDDNGRFTPLIWDLNMSFGSFRESDGSYHFRGLTIEQCKRLDPLEYLSFCISPRPLFTKLISNDGLQKVYFAHIRSILDENFVNGWYYQRASELQELIDPAVLNDVNKFYSYSDFHANLDSTVGGSGDMILYPGIKDLMEARVSYLDSLSYLNGQPVISTPTCTPDTPSEGTPFWITATVQNGSNVLLRYRFSSSSVFEELEMYDDGAHGDGDSGDNVYGAELIAQNHLIHYYIYAENSHSGSLLPPNAATQYLSVQFQLQPGDVVINEMNTESNRLLDEGVWVELFNNTNESLNLDGLSLQGSEVDDWYHFPDTILSAHAYMILHSGFGSYDPEVWIPFSIPSAGGKVKLWNQAEVLLDSVIYGEQVAGKTIGRYPNGFGAMSFMLPTYAAYNSISTTPSIGFSLYPNPAIDQVFVEIKPLSTSIDLSVNNVLGDVVYHRTYSFSSEQENSVILSVNISNLARGIYFVSASNGNMTQVKKLILE